MPAMTTVDQNGLYEFMVSPQTVDSFAIKRRGPLAVNLMDLNGLEPMTQTPVNQIRTWRI